VLDRGGPCLRHALLRNLLGFLLRVHLLSPE
jgi:hypothetical protein